MSFTSLSILIPMFAALMVYIQVRKGYKRGLTRSLINLAVLVGCAFFGTVISVAVAGAIVEPLNELFEEMGLYEGLQQLLGSAAAAVVILLRMIISLVLYLPIFFVLKSLVSIVVGIFTRRVSNKRNAQANYFREDAAFVDKYNHTLGAAVGVVSGLLISVVVLMPVVSTLKSAESIVEIADELAEGESVVDAEIAEDISLYANDFSATVLDVCGGRLLFDLTARANMYGQTTYFNKELEAVKSIDINEVQSAFEKISYATDKSVEEIVELLDTVGESFILKAIMISGINDASSAWLNGETYMGAARPEFGDHSAVEGFLNELLFVCSTSSFETVDADMETLVHLSNIFNERKETFSSDEYETVIDELILNGTADLIREELQKNAHMRPVLFAVDDLIMSVVTDELKNTMKYTEDECRELFGEFAEILNETGGLEGTVRLTAVTQQVKESLDDYGIYVPETLDSKVAELLIGGIRSDGSDISLEDVEEFFDQYVMYAENPIE